MRLFTIASIFLVGSILPLASAELVYERDVAPILRSYCSGCHNDADLSGGLSMERFASLRKGGTDVGDPIKPGQPGESFLIHSLEGTAKPKMPPKDEPKVPAAELDVLKRWIAEGAHGPKRDDSILETLVVPKVGRASKQRPAVTALTVSPDGHSMVVAHYAEIEVKSASGLRVLRKINGLPGKVNAVHYSPDGRQIVVATGITGLRGVAQIYEVATGKLIREFAGHHDTLQDAEFSPDGRILATAGYDKVIRLWDTDTGKLRKEIAVHNGAVFDLAFDPTGTVLASASADQTVKLWRVTDGVRLDTLNQPQGELYRVAFSADGQYIVAAGGDKRLHLWRFVSREKPGPNPVVESRFAHDTAIQVMAFSRDGKQLITAAQDRSVKIWSFPELVELQAFPAQSDVVTAFVGLPASGHFLSGRMDGAIEPLQFTPTTTHSIAAVDASSTPTEPATTNLVQIAEMEPNDLPDNAQLVTLPAEVKASISSGKDRDLYRFHARRGEDLALAINAARSGSKLDSRVEVLYPDGKPVEQVVLQAVRDSWITFRGKDSDTSDDFRLHNWPEMELDQYLYLEGEVDRLWLYPRGPDSGFKVYPGTGKRNTAFSTTPLTHAVNAPCYIVVPFPAGSHPVPNGLPVYRLNYENDDDPSRKWGADSLLLFTAPADGDYLARVTDIRGFGGATNYHYILQIRPRHPDFTVALDGAGAKISPGSGKEVKFTATRMEGFDGPIRIEIDHLPPGFSASTPVEIEAGQNAAVAAIYATTNAVPPSPELNKAVTVTAVANVAGHEVRRELGTLGELALGPAPKVTLTILPGNDPSIVKETPGEPLEFSIRPGQTITAMVRAVRNDFTNRIELGNEDSGRNLPHGIYVDNIGLNGLLIVEGQTEREFFITAAPIVKPGLRRFHLRTTVDGNQVSAPALLRVLPPRSMQTAQAPTSK